MPSTADRETGTTHRMLHAGLTGNIASGKSTVSKLLAERGATVIDADVLARRVVEPGTPALEEIREYFGDEVLSPDGTLDREAMRKIVFNNPGARSVLNGIVHPAVSRMRDAELQAARERGDRIVISDIPLLFETGLEHAFDAVIFVDASEDTRLRRLTEARGLPESDARAMMSAQWPAAEKRARSTFVVENNGSLGALAARVALLWQELSTLANSLERPRA